MLRSKTQHSSLFFVNESSLSRYQIYYRRHTEKCRERTRKWKSDIRSLLIERKGGKCEECQSTNRLELHEVTGNNDNHSTARFRKMRDGEIEYTVLCHSCHSDTDNWRGKKNG